MTDEQAAVIITLCRNLVMRYAVAIDSQDFDDFVSLFTEDAEFQRPGAPVLRGRREIHAFLTDLHRRRMAGNPAGHLQRHLFTTTWIDPVSESEARGVCCALAYRDVDFTGAVPSPMRMPELLIEYRDVFQRRDGRWLMHRHGATHLFSERPGSPAPAGALGG